jgi:hypothetical protein
MRVFWENGKVDWAKGDVGGGTCSVRKVVRENIPERAVVESKGLKREESVR